MDTSAMVNRQIEGSLRFLKEYEKFAPVAAALWHKPSIEDDWEFVIASDRFNAGAASADYGEVLRAAKVLHKNDFDPFQVSLIGLGTPLGRAAVEFYRTRPAKTPVHIRQGRIGNIEVEEAYLLKGPTGDYDMPSGREALNTIIDAEAAFYEQNGQQPRRMKLPVLMAYDLAKCGRNEIGDLSGKVFMEGITVFEREGFHGMNVEIVRDRNAALEFE